MAQIRVGAFTAARSSNLDVNVVNNKKVWAIEQRGFDETKEQFGRQGSCQSGLSVGVGQSCSFEQFRSYHFREKVAELVQFGKSGDRDAIGLRRAIHKAVHKSGVMGSKTQFESIFLFQCGTRIDDAV